MEISVWAFACSRGLSWLLRKRSVGRGAHATLGPENTFHLDFTGTAFAPKPDNAGLFARFRRLNFRSTVDSSKPSPSRRLRTNPRRTDELAYSSVQDPGQGALRRPDLHSRL